LIRHVVRPKYQAFRACYQQGLGTNPQLTGLVKVRFVISPDGAIHDVSNVGTDLVDDAVVTCILEVFRSLRFPPPSGGDVTVQYPIMLQPG
jgi:hypothetical protein